MEKAAVPTKSLRALELFSRAQDGGGARRPEPNENAVDLLSRAIEVDANFVVAQYNARRRCTRPLGNRWKAAAPGSAPPPSSTRRTRSPTRRSATCSWPRRGDSSTKARGAYNKAHRAAAFYADAHVGLGDARAAKGEIDGAISA